MAKGQVTIPKRIRELLNLENGDYVTFVVIDEKIQIKEIVMIVENAKERAYRKVNEELILMYQEAGKYISEKTKGHLMALVLLIM